MGQRYTVRLRLVADGTPRAGRAYTLELDEGTVRQGTTDADGFLVEHVPAATAHVTVRVEVPDFGTEEYVLRLGQLDPADAPRGLQQRLRNLGFTCAPSGELDAQTRQALALFQAPEGRDASSTPDASKVQRLEEAHGA